ncbi:aryl-alcohol dehydrogenase-like predicted oxidoreductase [Actinoplanes octamycinicus]|uniref:Aryl-alcohol dehydrogenase-like predicted oxidoreductase n=1 Tax=Actinoplanes octamycinicus TaxID=135948 RepID=A0A7W7M7X8_9ACTN|nr:aldo/keto reductase [Actinoplanes octamycinicus]MBB4740206.1 aryl-alcohol dehydrogenase-like predicted oxidoreductase [Actinoplanes octamycinicus]GIE59602.1 aldo/keto reductase [Actinoplanes octamycinicus]
MTTTRALGTTGMELSTAGLGAWVMGGADWQYAWGPQDDADSIATIHAAVGAGINWIDTAAAYGLGHSEEVVGRAVAALPAADRPLLFTKAGLVWDDPARRDAPPRRVLTAASARRELEASLRRLRTDHIDLYQVHWPADGRLLTWGDDDGSEPVDGCELEEYWQTMADLRAEGKVRAIGLSNHGVAELERAEKVAHVDAIQPPFSVLVRDAADQIDWAAGNGTGVIVYQPMHSGLLTGAFDAARVAALPANDWRRGHPDFTTRLPANLRVVDALRAVADRHGVPVAAVAVAWVLARPGVTGAIVGARRPEQIAGWLPGADLTLTGKDLAGIAACLSFSGD